MDSFRAIYVDAAPGEAPQARVEQLPFDRLPPGEVVIRVEYSSINYKDALAHGGHKGIVGRLPHVPGIDCAGVVVESTSLEHRIGDAVLVTGYGLGAECWGGWSQLVRVPADWVVPLPPSLSARDAMILGTAGFTAAQCVQAIELRGIGPDSGEVLVTGATGGVGLWSVAILAKLGYRVAAVSGKPQHHEGLRELGAQAVLDRSDVIDTSSRPLLSNRWVAAVDTVGGQTLSTIVRSLSYRGVVAACGLVGGDQLPLSVYPFLLRGIWLCGIDSAKCPRPNREECWRLLANDWRCALPERWVREVNLDGVAAAVAAMLAGQNSGRVLVTP